MNPQSISVQLPVAVASLVSESVLTGYGNLATGADFSASSKAVSYTHLTLPTICSV